MVNDVISQSQQFVAGLGQLWRDQLTRLEAASEEATKLRQQGAVRTSEVLDELARLGKASLDYSTRLCTEWSRVSLEAWRRSAETMAPTAPEAPASKAA